MAINIYHICIIGLGYVGLPLARLFSTKYKTIGFDANKQRIDEIMSGQDTTKEMPETLLKEALKKGFRCSSWSSRKGKQKIDNPRFLQCQSQFALG